MSHPLLERFFCCLNQEKKQKAFSSNLLTAFITFHKLTTATGLFSPKKKTTKKD
jgi:hypothetical protein